MFGINDNVDTDSTESNHLMPFKNLFNKWFVRGIPAARSGRC